MADIMPFAWYLVGYISAYWAGYFLTNGDFMHYDKEPDKWDYVFLGVMGLGGPVVSVLAIVWGILFYFENRETNG